MSRFKIGQTVLIEKEYAVAKIIDINRVTTISQVDDKITTKLIYLVKIKSNNCWTEVSKDDIRPLKHVKAEPNFVDIYGYVNNRNITISGYVKKSGSMYDLSVGVAICSPSDENDKNLGIKIARKRCLDKPMRHFYSPAKKNFTNRVISTILSDCMNEIKENVKKMA